MFELVTKAQGDVLANYARDRGRVSIIMGPLGSGKTIQTCIKVFDLMCEQPADQNGIRKSRWLAIRNTYSDLQNTTIKDWLELFGDETLGRFLKGGSEPPSHKLSFQLEDGTCIESELIFLAMDRDDSVKKLRGTQLTGLWLNEVKELNKSILDMADGRHGRYPSNCGWHGILGDTNAPDEDEWLYRIMEEEKPRGWNFFKQPGGLKRGGKLPNGRVRWVFNEAAENVSNLPDGAGYYTRMKGGKTDDWIAVNIANEYGYVANGKSVWSEYSDAVHCKEFEFIEDVPIIRGWDFGLTPSVIYMQLTPKGRLIVRHEIVGDNIGAARFCDEYVLPFSIKYRGWEFIDMGDPAGMQRGQANEVSCFDELWDRGIIIEAAVQNPGKRIDSVRHFLNRMVEGSPAFILHPECKIVRKAMKGGYQFRRMQVQGERYMDKPDKNKYSHPADALQYGASYARNCKDDEELDDDHHKHNDARGAGGY